MCKELYCITRFKNFDRRVWTNAATPSEGGDVFDRAIEGAKAKETPAEKDANDVANGLTAKVAVKQRQSLSTEVDEKNALDENGKADEYFEKFKNSPDLYAIHSLMRSARESDPNGLNDFSLWHVRRRDAAMLFDDGFGQLFMPRGRGRKAFVEGLKAQEGTPQFDESDKVLTKITDLLQARVDVDNNAKAALAKQANTPLTGNTVDKYINTFKNSWNRASPTTSVLLAGAIGAVVYWGWGKKDDILPFAEKMTYGEGAVLAAMLGGVNLLSGAFSPDGKTLLNRMGTGTDAGVPDIGDPFIRNYAYEHKMDDNKTKLLALTTTMNLDMKHLYRLYRDASDINSTERKIDITKLGLAPGIIDGEQLYNIIDEVVEKAAENHIKDEYKFENNITDDTQIDNNELSKRIEESKRDKGVKLAYFEDKYLKGRLSGTNQTLLQTIINENYEPNKDYKASVKEYDDKHVLNCVSNWTQRAAIDTVDWLKDNAGPFVVKNGSGFIGYVDDKVITPSGQYLRDTYRTYEPKLAEFVEEKMAAVEQGSVERVTDVKFWPKVTSYVPGLNEGTGEVTIKGVPKFPLSDKSENGHKFLYIGAGADAQKFDGAKDAKGNKKPNEKLDAMATKKAKDAYAEAVKEAPEKTQFLANKDIDWNASKGVWYIKNVDAPVYTQGSALYDNPPVNAELKFSKEGKVSFVINGKPLEEIEDLAKSNLEAVLAKMISDDNRFAEIKGLPVSVLAVEPYDRTGYKIKVTIGGLQTYMVPRDVAGVTDNRKINIGFSFLKDDGTEENSLAALNITQANGGEAFLLAKTEQILTSQKYLDPFLRLENIANRTQEDLWDRAKDVSLSGPIKDRKWKILIDFKMREALELYKSRLANKSAADMDTVYGETIRPMIRQIENLESKMKNAAPDERKERFDTYMHYLERAGSVNDDYTEMFDEYMVMIEQFDLGGSESWENPVLDVNSDRYKVYQEAMLIWSLNTQKYNAGTDPNDASCPVNKLSDSTKQEIRTGIIEVIKKKLEHCAAENDGKLTNDNLIPKPTNVDAAHEWVKQEN